MLRKTSLIITIVFVFQIIYCSENVNLWPVPDWPVADSPEAVGMSSCRLDEYVSWLSAKAEGEPFGTAIIRRGKIVSEYYGSGAADTSKWEIGSIRKPIGSTLLGIALEEGKLDLEQIANDIWPEIFSQTGNDKDKMIQVRHLFNSSSGWKREEHPGTKWVYNNSAFTVGGMVVGRVYNVPDDRIAPLVKKRIADRIGASDWYCYHYPDDFASSYRNPGPKLAVNSNMRDLARFGYLWLRNGEWNGEQIVSKSYIKEATQNQVANLNKHYGYCWFINDGKVLLPNAPEDAYFHIGNGKGGRRTVLMVIPSLDLISVVGTHNSKYDITDGYKSEPIPDVNEWIGKIIKCIQDDSSAVPAISQKIAANGHFSDIAVDNKGNIHLVYGRNDSLFYKKYDITLNKWNPEQSPGIKISRIERSEPDIVIDSKDRVHVFAGSDYAYRNGSGWEKIGPGVNLRDTELAIDGADNVYLVHRNGNNGGYMGIKKLSPGSDSWEALTDPDKSSLGRNNHVYPDLSISPVDNSLHIVYRHGTPKNTSYRQSQDNGNTWKIQEGITDNDTEAPHVVVDYSNNVYAIDGQGNFYKKSGNEWIVEDRVVSSPRRGMPKLAVDRSNNIYCGCWGGNYNIRINGNWIGNRFINRVTGRKVTGFVEFAGMSDFAYIVWEEGNTGIPETGIEGDSVIIVAKLCQDGNIINLGKKRCGSSLTLR